MMQRRRWSISWNVDKDADCYLGKVVKLNVQVVGAGPRAVCTGATLTALDEDGEHDVVPVLVSCRLLAGERVLVGIFSNHISKLEPNIAV